MELSEIQRLKQLEDENRRLKHAAIEKLRQLDTVVAPGHCTSEPGFAAFMRKLGNRFDEAGVGAVLQLPR